MTDGHLNPLDLLREDRATARAQEDGWAAVCTLATLDAEGVIQQRTLVLRELHERLALFFSATAPKWQELKRSAQCSIALYLPSVQVQYRLQCLWAQIEADQVHASWQLRPDIPKRLDWLYQTQPQSSAIDREALLAALATTDDLPQSAPESAMGIYLDPVQIERLELSSGVHDRRRFRLADDGTWHLEHLMP